MPEEQSSQKRARRIIEQRIAALERAGRTPADAYAHVILGNDPKSHVARLVCDGAPSREIRLAKLKYLASRIRPRVTLEIDDLGPLGRARTGAHGPTPRERRILDLLLREARAALPIVVAARREHAQNAAKKSSATRQAKADARAAEVEQLAEKKGAAAVIYVETHRGPQKPESIERSVRNTRLRQQRT